jgi:hypothetical protein
MNLCNELEVEHLKVAFRDQKKANDFILYIYFGDFRGIWRTDLAHA